MNLFVFGLGYSALNFVTRHRNEFVSIKGSVRSVEKRDRLAAEGIGACVWRGNPVADVEAAAHDRQAKDMDVLDMHGMDRDGMDRDGMELKAVKLALADTDELIISIAPDADGDAVLNTFGAAIMAAPLLRTIVYLSTIGVYGDHDGAWIDENTVANPGSVRSQYRLKAEADWIALAKMKGVDLHILRLAGIYGPGRSAIDNLQAGKARRIIKPGQVFNRIHVDDIAKTIAACFNAPATGEVAIWNVTDDEPAPPQDVVAFAASLLGMEVPPDVPFEQADLSAMGRSFYSENKRVSNERLRLVLGVDLDFPTYREGLANVASVQGPQSAG